MSRFERQKYFVELLTSGSKKQQQQLVKTLTLDQTAAIEEFFINLLKGRIPVSPNLVQRMRRNQKYFEALAERKKSLKEKRVQLQKGRGIFLPILAAALPAALSLFAV